MKTDKLSAYLEEKAKAYAEKANAADFYAFEDKAYKYCKITLDKIRLEFVYSLKGSASYPISTLTCRVYLDTTDSPYFYEIPELIDYLDIYDYHCYCFPYIENKKRLDACFDYITDFIEYRMEEICSLRIDREEIKARKLREIKRVLGYDSKSAPKDKPGKDAFYGSIFKHYSDSLIPRYTTNKAYFDFVNRDYQSSLNRYKKISAKTGYERKLVAFIKEQKAPYQAVTPECASIIEVRQYKNPSLRTFIILIASCAAFSYVLLLLIQLLINQYYLKTARFVDISNPFLSALCGIIPGIAIAIAFRKRIEPLMLKNKKQALEFYDLLNISDTSHNTMYFAAVVTLLFLFLFTGMSRPNILITDKKVTVNKSSSMFGHYVDYDLDEFVNVVYVYGYYDDDRNFIKHPFYAFLTAEQDYFTTRDLKLTDEQIKELIAQVVPMLDGYSLREIGTLEDL